MNQSEAGKRLQRAREAKELRLDDAAYLARQELPGLKCSRETVRRYEIAAPEDTWNPNIVLALSRVYGVDLRDISAVAADSLVSVLELVGVGPDGGVPRANFPCNPAYQQTSLFPDLPELPVTRGNFTPSANTRSAARKVA